MTTQDQKQKVRLSVDCTEEERKYIKMLAAKSEMTISEYLLSYARQDMPATKCTKSHVPNNETKKALRESRKGHLKTYTTLSDFWSEMGMTP